jgi:polyisoprenoid-binding protein YceI
MNKTTTKATPGRKKPWLKWVVGGGLLVVVLAAVGIWWFLRDDAPPPVSLDAAVNAVQTTAAPADTAATAATSADTTATAAPVDAASNSTASNSTTAPAAVSSGIDGNWAVDDTVGEFSFEDSTGTFVGFRVDEELSSIGSTTAVGRTPAVTGTMAIAGTSVTAADIEADMTQLTTNNSRRDGPARGALGTRQFPTATFKLTAPIELGDAAATGAKTSVTATGDLTIKGVTKSVQFPLEAQLTGDTVVVVGSLDVAFSDFGITAPRAPIVVSVDDHGQIELQLFFTRS